MKKYYVISCFILTISLVGIQNYSNTKKLQAQDLTKSIIERNLEVQSISKTEPALPAKTLELDPTVLRQQMIEETERDKQRFAEEERKRQEELRKQYGFEPTIIRDSGNYSRVLGNSEQYNTIDNLDSKIDQMFKVSKDLIGTPYVWGGTTPYKSMDCSGFTQYVMGQLGYNIPRVSKDQSKYGQLVSRTELMPGDLLFFDTTNPRDSSDIRTPSQEMQYAQQVEDGYAPVNVSHVGIYLGDGVMIHASSGDGIITYADLSSNYYKNRFMNARRVIR